MANINEVFCEAVDTIVTERLKGIQFDRTILCSIVDATKAKEGQYLVATLSSNISDINENNFSTEEEQLDAMVRLSTTFDAYSQELYTNGQYVYVLVPNGDFSQQKTIIGKYVANSEEPYKVSSPFEQFIDMTGNILPKSDTTYSLIANGKKEIANNGDALNKDPTIEIDFSTNPLKAFTRLGLQANFSAKLAQQKCIVGSYGIEVILTVENITYSDKDEAPITTTKQVSIDLNSSNFIGNPYSFEGFYKQEIVVDISAYSSIVGAQLRFYQRPGSFKNNEYLDVPWRDEFGNAIEPNLFVKDIYLGIGYGLGDVGKDTLFIYTFDETSYEQVFNPATHAPYPMKRSLKVRWIHQDEQTGQYETVSDLSSLYTSERTSAVLAADSALQSIGQSLQTNTKLGISTSFYNSYLNIMADYRNGTAESIQVGKDFNYVLATNPNNPPLTTVMTANIRKSFIDDLDQYIKDLFKRLHIYRWSQEQADSFVSPKEDIKTYYGTENAETKDPPYYKFRYDTYEAQFNHILDALEPGAAASIAIEQDATFKMPAKLEDNTDIFIILNMPLNFATNCVIPFWRNTIDDVRNSVKSVYDENQSIISRYQYQLRWYHYRLGATIKDSDVYAGADWRRIDKDFLMDDTLLDPNPESLTNQFEFSFTPNPKKRTEQFKCILLAGYNEDQDGNAVVFHSIHSKVFTFSNRGKVVDVDTVEKVEALSIHCTDNTFGNYFIYNLGGGITNTTEPERIRYLEAYFNPGAETMETAPLREAQTITWTFPLDTFAYTDETGANKFITGYTMLEPEISLSDVVRETDETADQSDTNKMYILTSSNLLERVYTRKKQRYQYETIGEVVDNYPDIFKIDIAGQKLIYTYKCFKDGSIFNSFGYRIKNYYSQENTVNNSVGCSIIKNFIAYNAVKAFNFGPSGTQGAEVTLAVNFNRDKDTLYNAVTQMEHVSLDKTTVTRADFRPARFSAFLYDADSNLVDISGVMVTCQWAECVSAYKATLDRWFIIEEYKDEDGRWINNIPTWEIHYRDEYKEKKMSNPLFEQVTASSPIEAIDLANSVKNARVNLIVEITISSYGRYDTLKTYLPIPQKTIYHSVEKKILL